MGDAGGFFNEAGTIAWGFSGESADRAAVKLQLRVRSVFPLRSVSMPREILNEEHIHPAIRGFVANYQNSVVTEVRAAAAANAVLVVGMRGNPVCRRARKLLSDADVAHEYVEYGSYVSQWRRRNALKMWTGWPTFPMVFVRGALVGGADDLGKLIRSGELATLLK
jgi:monothiol glutaredoxin